MLLSLLNRLIIDSQRFSNCPRVTQIISGWAYAIWWSDLLEFSEEKWACWSMHCSGPIISVKEMSAMPSLRSCFTLPYEPQHFSFNYWVSTGGGQAVIFLKFFSNQLWMGQLLPSREGNVVQDLKFQSFRGPDKAPMSPRVVCFQMQCRCLLCSQHDWCLLQFWEGCLR